LCRQNKSPCNKNVSCKTDYSRQVYSNFTPTRSRWPLLLLEHGLCSNICSKMELWLTSYNLTKSYKLEQSTLSGIPKGQQEFLDQPSWIFSNTCSIDAAQAHLCVHVRSFVCLPELRISEVEAWNTQTFSIDAAQAQLCTHVTSLTLQPSLRLASQKFTSEGFLLENLQSNPTSTPIRTRKPDQVSEDVLASIWFSQINTMLIIWLPLAKSLTSVACTLCLETGLKLVLF